MIGKYNATATTTLIGVQNVTASSIDAELTNIRKSLFKYSFIPTASVGLTYRYN
jgi:ribosome-interacting GTPase 1